MSRVFIDRPIFAWVLAIIVMMAGVGAIMKLPIAQYPDVAPPQVSVRANYPGANALTIQNSVTQVIEQSFGLNLERLAAGGQDLAEGKGELGAALFTAASPIASLQRQVAEIDRVGSKQRSRAQCALTHFDEGGVIVLLRDPALLPLWNAHDWHGLFWRERMAWTGLFQAARASTRYQVLLAFR